MQLLSALLLAVTASVASAAVASPDLVDRGLLGPFCNRGIVSVACERQGLHGYCCTDTPTPGQDNFLRDVTEARDADGNTIACGGNGGKVWCGV
ncbi:uncharacterized protein CPUR_06797 [Claviceps purpurea 20.1]|uniref:Uncharacterized protein n=1 Tax=Claviceps purpurea (strain 20.1) TaxID=1111077 RepID=M1W3Q1_CLAP2|nr:hypothetical protein E4U50_002986 [Claviceps purpurea]KAG6289356.1 hypothetical protein E4U46_002626 [Claviceps purpurea]CCE32931.1 uncharacterized protein CPUR_06797 [Claviceps purpurea 20.1]